MTTPDNYHDTGKLERMLDGIQRKVTGVGADLKAMSDRMTELVNTTDSIYAIIANRHDAPTYPTSNDDLLDGLEE